MKLPAQERVFYRYIYVNPDSNIVHLMMPVVSGNSIGLDNTCKSVVALSEFFADQHETNLTSAILELKNYRSCLLNDIELLVDGKVRANKLIRLNQIENYIEAIKNILSSNELDTLDQEYPEYPHKLKSLMISVDKNLYSMRLRPREQDNILRATKPSFSISRRNNDQGEPVSFFYNYMQLKYSELNIVPNDIRKHLIDSVIASTYTNCTLANIQAQLTKYALNILKEHIDFTETNGVEINAEFINDELGDEYNTLDIIETLLGYCAPKAFDTIKESPFKTIRETTTARAVDRLSIITQFFIASVNIYCESKRLTIRNFGRTLDTKKHISAHLIENIVSAFNANLSVENSIIEIINLYQAEFQLERALDKNDAKIIKDRFIADFLTIKDSPHFDEFMLLDYQTAGLFVEHQGFITTNFAYFARKVLQEPNEAYWEQVILDYRWMQEAYNSAPDPKQPWVLANQNLDVETTLEVSSFKHLIIYLNRFSLTNQLKLIDKVSPELYSDIDLADFIIGLHRLKNTLIQMILIKKFANNLPANVDINKLIPYLIKVHPDYQAELIERINIENFAGINLTENIEHICGLSPNAQVILLERMPNNLIINAQRDDLIETIILLTPLSLKIILEKLNPELVIDIIIQTASKNSAIQNKIITNLTDKFLLNIINNHLDLPLLKKQDLCNALNRIMPRMQAAKRAICENVITYLNFANIVASSDHERITNIIIAADFLDLQKLLTTQVEFADNAGRRFKCLPLEYAYWSGDIKMFNIITSNLSAENQESLPNILNNLRRNGIKYIYAEDSYVSTQYNLSSVLHNLRPEEFLILKAILKGKSRTVDNLSIHNYQYYGFTHKEYTELKETITNKITWLYSNIHNRTQINILNNKIKFAPNYLMTIITNVIRKFDNLSLDQQISAETRIMHAISFAPTHISKKLISLPLTLDSKDGLKQLQKKLIQFEITLSDSYRRMLRDEDSYQSERLSTLNK